MSKKSCLILISILVGLTLLMGCSTSEPTHTPRTNLKRKIILKKHLNRLNRENLQLQQMLNDASLVNIETYQVLDSDFVTKERVPEFQQILERFKAINLDTQIALNDLENEIRSDTQQIETIEKLLEGIVPDNSDQQMRKDKLADYLKRTPAGEIIDVYDRIHIGVSVQGFRANITADYGANSSNEVIYQGTANSLYFTYVGEYNTLISFQHSVFTGQSIEDDPDPSSDNQKEIVQSTINSLSIGGRVESIRSFNVLPQLVLGMGTTRSYSCPSVDCSPKTYGIADSKLVGLEIPAYQQLSSVFSWGIKASVYNIVSEDIEYYVNEQKIGVIKGNSSVMLGGLGVMIGAAW